MIGTKMMRQEIRKTNQHFLHPPMLHTLVKFVTMEGGSWQAAEKAVKLCNRRKLNPMSCVPGQRSTWNESHILVPYPSASAVAEHSNC